MLLPTRTIRVTVAAAAAVLAVGLTACGSDDSSTNATSSSTSISAAPSSVSATPAPTGDNAGAPSADSLKATLVQFADPGLSSDEKAKLIVNGEARKANIDQMNGMLAGYTLTFAVDNVATSGDKATADVTITSPHGTAPAFPVTWERVDGTWKLSDASGCLLLGFAQAPCTPA
ncbi:hypothetical protein [Nocardia coubleae]|uniref:Low molecular weight antigen MTB12-like C-terminal domain-containing protein n=1 Tax=Nocardia coubleae TaxID=356147 RepID=A0A846VYT0_9NOCA|nr:hypothetical protein [Nocardia coubleae]NKX85706.1 hypothetical protein [Nocardia coubleae]